ncbi:hypothetical protein C4L39_26290 [Clostridium diolis]|nr:hypothetical protein C4L39_26290 [Clostridium diolis]
MNAATNDDQLTLPGFPPPDRLGGSPGGPADNVADRRKRRVLSRGLVRGGGRRLGQRPGNGSAYPRDLEPGVHERPDGDRRDLAGRRDWYGER